MSLDEDAAGRSAIDPKRTYSTWTSNSLNVDVLNNTSVELFNVAKIAQVS